MPERSKADQPQPGKIGRAARHVWCLVVELTRKYAEDRGPLIAAAVSFFALLSIIPILLPGGSLVLSLLITSTLTAIRTYSLQLVGWPPGQIPAVWSVIGAIVSVSLTILSFTVVYRVIPNTRVPWRSALIAGTTAGLL